MNIGFVGGGNMARSLIGGLLSTGRQPAQLYVSEPDVDKRRYFVDQFGVHADDDNQGVVAVCDLVVLAVKPQLLQQVLLPLRSHLQDRRPLLLSIAAGIREPDIQRWCGGEIAIVRAMPNTPALVGSGATGLYANSIVNREQRDVAESLMRAVGVTVWLEQESLLDPVTALSGSGPAYFMLFMEALEDAARDSGLDAKTARLLTLETCVGAAKLALESGEELSLLRRRVTSPGGTTERAVAVMEQARLREIVAEAFNAASTRADELGTLLGGQEDG